MTKKKVEIYTTAYCVYCRLAKAFLEENHITYNEYNVGLDAVRRQEMVDKSGQLGVPVIVVSGEEGGEQVIIGFDKPTLKSALAP